MAVLTKEKAAEHLQAMRLNRYAVGGKEGDDMDQSLAIALAALGEDGKLEACPVCRDAGKHDPGCWYCLGTNVDTVAHPGVGKVAKRALGWPA